MLEFIFFDHDLCQRFVAYLAKEGIESKVRDDHFGWVVGLDETLLDDMRILAIEAEYEALEHEQMHLTEEGEGGLEKFAAGFGVALPSGETILVDIPPNLATRLIAQFTLDEIHEMFSRVAAQALQPDHRPVCQRDGS